MVKNKTKIRKKTRLRQSHPPTDNQPATNEPSTSGSSHDFAASASGEEPRVPPLPEQPPPPAYAGTHEVLSNRKIKLLKKLQLQKPKRGPGHMKIRAPAGTPLTTYRVPPTETVQSTSCRVSADITSTVGPLPSVKTVRALSTNLKTALSTSNRLTRVEIQPPITPGNLRRQRALNAAGKIGSTGERSDSASSSQDFDAPLDMPLPSFIFTPTSEKGETECGRREPSSGTVESYQDDSGMGSQSSEPNRNVGKVTSVKFRKLFDKFDNEKGAAGSIVEDAEMDILARAFRSIQMDDEELVSESASQSFTYISENSDSVSEDPIVLGDEKITDEGNVIESVSSMLVGSSTRKDRNVSEAAKNSDETDKECRKMRDCCANVLEEIDEYIAKAVDMKAKILAGDFPSGDVVSPDSIMAVNIIPIVDIVQSTSQTIKTALGIDGSGGTGADDLAQSLETAELTKSAVTSDDTEAASEKVEAPAHSRTIADDKSAANEQLEASSDEKPAVSQVESVENRGAEGLWPISDGQKVGDEQQKAGTHPKTISSQVKSGEIFVEDKQSAVVSGQGAAVEQEKVLKRSKTQKVESGVRLSEEASALIPCGTETGVKEDDGEPTLSVDSSGRAAAVDGSEEKVEDRFFRVAENKETVLSLLSRTEPKTYYVDVNFVRALAGGRIRPTVYADKEKVILLNKAVCEGRVLANLRDLPFHLAIDVNRTADENASTELDLNIHPPPRHCPARTYCLETCRLRSHLATCWYPMCKEKHCWKATQVIGHWIHCVEKNCEVCPAFEKNDAEEVREKLDWLNKVIRTNDLRDHLMEQRATSSELSEFLTHEGQSVILGYYVQYFYEVFVAFNVLLKEAGMRALNIPDDELPEKEFIETVRHSCYCLPLNNCRLNHCHRLRMVIAHWSKWNGLCHTIDCRLCDRIYKRFQKENSEVSELIDFLNGEPGMGKATILMDQLIQMVHQSADNVNIKSKLNWKDLARIQFRNACVNSCVFADVRYGEMDGNANAPFDLVALFNKHDTYKLLVLARYIIYRAISLKEHDLFIESPNLATYLVNSYKQGVKMIRAVHGFIKTELSLSDDTWESGIDILNSSNIGQNKRYLMQMGFKINNKLKEYFDAISDYSNIQDST